ncbi:dioxygenase [Gammaproteobacteria bacterium AH-315-E17]|nr:dioxygenase [bacterium AH-315-I11]MBN4075642.1 dioxygenase [Gammaproteobacteria bacterium AH-315-E17]
MLDQSLNKLSPVLYLPHGAGPLPLLGDPMHKNLIKFLKELPASLGQYSAILLISAHWEEDQATVTSASKPELIYDYYGFPPESYSIKYDAAGNPELAAEVVGLLTNYGVNAQMDETRGYDHGLFVPLKLMYPKGEIPCIQLSLLKSMDPAQHIQLGKAIASLRKKNVLVIGSGMSFHNMQALRAVMNGVDEAINKSYKFTDWLIETCTGDSFSNEDRENRLINWENSPYARFCHPREEHLLPLHVCYGIASMESSKAEVIYNDEIFGVCGLMWT